MKKLALIISVAMAVIACNNAPKVGSTVPYKVKNGTIVFKEQPREPGQTSALRLACEPLDTVRVAIVGCGSRGTIAFKMRYIDKVKIVAFCDLYQDHVDAFYERLDGYKDQDVHWTNYGYKPRAYVGPEAYKEVCECDDVDLVYITTDWKVHTPIAVYAMEHGKHAAVEVPAATTLEECWQLVNTCEKTRRHCIMLENSVYDRDEMMIHNLVQHGMFGEVYYGAGAYIHNLDSSWPKYTDGWRLVFNQEHRGDNYPTHGLGPVCRDMKIHRGDKMNTLTCMDSGSFRGKEWGKKMLDTTEFKDGEHTVTLIRTEKEHLIEVQHNVYGVAPYSRIHELMGTEGYVRLFPCFDLTLLRENLPADEIYDGVEDLITTGGHPSYKSDKYTQEQYFNKIREEYDHPVYKELGDLPAKVGGHGGMDFVMQYRLIYCLQHGLPLDMDVYDAAEWSCLRELTEVSLNAGSMPVQVPDFTRGDWDKLDDIVFEK